MTPTPSGSARCRTCGHERDEHGINGCVHGWPHVIGACYCPTFVAPAEPVLDSPARADARLAALRERGYERVNDPRPAEPAGERTPDADVEEHWKNLHKRHREAYRLPADVTEQGLDRNAPDVSSEKAFTIREAEMRVIAAAMDWADNQATDETEALAREMGIVFCLADLAKAFDVAALPSAPREREVAMDPEQVLTDAEWDALAAHIATLSRYGDGNGKIGPELAHSIIAFVSDKVAAALSPSPDGVQK